MDRRPKVELFEEIRREYEFGSGSVRAVAKKLGVHRRLVRQAMASALPPERTYTPRPAPRLDPVKPFIDSILKADYKRHASSGIQRSESTPASGENFRNIQSVGRQSASTC